MGRRIVYFTNGYLPDREGVSKELLTLYSYFSRRFQGEVYLHNLAQNWRFSLRRDFASYPAGLLPIGYPLIKYLERTSKLVHIYGSATGRLYLGVIKKRPCILTSTSALITTRLEQCVSAWTSIDVIVVESERDKITLEAIGVDSQKISLVYPGVPIHNIQPPPRNAPFTILFASAPIARDSRSFQRRGVPLLLQLARRVPDCHFIFLWRETHTETLSKLMSETAAKNVEVVNKIVTDIGGVLKNAHATILSPETSSDSKPCPISLIESLACGRPLLVSNQVGIADLIEQEHCGVIFPPNIDAAENAVRKLQYNYEDYVINAQPTALKYFSVKTFLDAYESLYNKFGIM
jgi:glycosyltransferase involved in cell wall biosynthesis